MRTLGDGLLKKDKKNRVRLFHGRLDHKFISGVTLDLMSVNTFPFFELSLLALCEKKAGQHESFFVVVM